MIGSPPASASVGPLATIGAGAEFCDSVDEFSEVGAALFAFGLGALAEFSADFCEFSGADFSPEPCSFCDAFFSPESSDFCASSAFFADFSATCVFVTDKRSGAFAFFSSTTPPTISTAKIATGKIFAKNLLIKPLSPPFSKTILAFFAIFLKLKRYVFARDFCKIAS